MKQLEANIERAFVDGCAGMGVLALKFTPRGNDGWPDRILLASGQRVAWYELKAEGEEPEKLQESRIRQLRRLGFSAGWGDNLEDALAWVERWLAG